MRLYTDVVPALTGGAKSPWSLLSELSKTPAEGSNTIPLLQLPVAEQLGLLHLLRSHLRSSFTTLGPAPLGPSWSANCLRPLLDLQAATTSHECQGICQLLLQQLLARLGLHTGPAETVCSCLCVAVTYTAASHEAVLPRTRFLNTRCHFRTLTSLLSTSPQNLDIALLISTSLLINVPISAQSSVADPILPAFVATTQGNASIHPRPLSH